MTDDEVYGEDDELEDEPLDEESIFIQEEIKECFAIFDQKNKGYIPSRLLYKALKTLGIELTETELADVLLQYERDGTIEYKDFYEIATFKIREIEPALHLKIAFSVFDKDGEGVIPTDRLKRWMTTLGNPLTESEAKELCRMGDPSGKGLFSYSDVVNMLIY